MKIFSRILWLNLTIAVGTSLAAADQSKWTRDPLIEYPLMPLLVTFAQAHNIPIERLEVGVASAIAHASDQVSFVIISFRGDFQQQWLLTLAADELTEKERSLPLIADDVVYTSTGLTLRFTRSRAALDIFLAGPFAATAPSPADPQPRETRTRVLVSPEYLSKGVERYGRSALAVGRRIRDAGAINIGYATQPVPFSESELKVGRIFAEKYSLTPEEERWENEAYFAMSRFFETAQTVPEIKALARPVLDEPSVWSAATHLGVNTSLAFRWEHVTAIAASDATAQQTAYQIPLGVLFNGKLGVKATLIGTAPHPPLQVCAGIIAISAEHPTNPANRLLIRAIASRRGK